MAPPYSPASLCASTWGECSGPLPAELLDPFLVDSYIGHRRFQSVHRVYEQGHEVLVDAERLQQRDPFLDEI